MSRVRRDLLRTLGWLVGGLLAATCYHPQIASGALECGPDGLCPEGFLCRADNRCVSGSSALDASVTGSSDRDLAILGDGNRPADAGPSVDLATCQPRTLAFVKSTAATFPSMSGPAAVVVGDLNGDQKLDLAATTYKTN